MHSLVQQVSAEGPGGGIGQPNSAGTKPKY